MNPLKWLNGFKCTHQNQSSNTLYFDYVSTTNECIDLPYIATICQDMYEKSMSLGIVTIPCTFLKVAKHGKIRLFRRKKHEYSRALYLPRHYTNFFEKALIYGQKSNF